METLVVNGSHSYLIFPRTDNETGVSISILKIKSSWYPKSTMLFNFNEQSSLDMEQLDFKSLLLDKMLDSA